MAKLTSKDLELKADDLTKKIEESREIYADLILEGKPDRGQMAELSTLETELKSTIAAIAIAKRREKEEAERLQAERQEKAKSEAGRIRNQAVKQLGALIDHILEAVNGAGVFIDTLQKGKDTLYGAGLSGQVMNDSEYYEVVGQVVRIARGLYELHPKRAYPGHDDLKAELEPFIQRFERKF